MTSRERAPDRAERFFYHSFPRRGRGSDGEIGKGCKILSLICDAGLVLAPEIVPWSYPHADGSPPRRQQTIQRRICFTELAPNELIEHAKEFRTLCLGVRYKHSQASGRHARVLHPSIGRSRHE